MPKRACRGIDAIPADMMDTINPAPAPAEVLKGGKMKVKKVKVKCDNKSCPEGLCAVAVEKKSKKKN